MREKEERDRERMESERGKKAQKEERRECELIQILMYNQLNPDRRSTRRSSFS